MNKHFWGELVMLAFLEGLQFVDEGIEKCKLIITQFEDQFLRTLSSKMKFN
jgi:hypothetical protein